MSRTRSLSKLIGPSGSQAFDTNTLVIDAANNRVGIGTISPSQKLTLNSGYVQTGNGVGGAGGVKFPYGGNAETRNWRARTDLVGYGDWGLEQSTTQTGETYATKLLIDASGNVGIGTSFPTARLQLSSTVNPGLVFDGTNQATDLKRIRIATQVATAGDFAIQSMNDAGSVKSTNLYINASGNVGIGTSSPTHKLNIISDGGAQLRIAAWDQSTTARANIDFWYLDAGGSPYNNAQISTLAAANAGNGNLVFSTRPTSGSLTEAMTITSDRVTIPQYLQPIKYKPNIQWQAVTGGFTTGCSANTWYSITNFDVNGYNSDRAAGARGLWYLIYWTSGNVNRGYNHTVTGHIPTMGANPYIGYQNGSYVTSAIGSAQYSGLPIQVSHHTGCASGHIIETRVWGNGTNYGELNIQIKAEAVPDAAGAYISVWRV